MGTRDGSIIATIITTHMPRNDAAAPVHDCPGIRIHAIDIVQPPGIGISPIADMDAHQAIVTAALPAKRRAETPRKERSPARSVLAILVVAPEPDVFLVAAQGSAVEPLVHPPETVQPARVRGIRVVYDAVLERERAHP